MDFRTETQYRQEISVVWVMIDQLKAENATLKEQVAQLKSSVQHEADCVDSAAAEINRQAAENDKFKETIAQQADVIEQMREALANHSGNYKLTKAECKVINEALALQPSPEILKARDEKVAEACAKVIDTHLNRSTYSTSLAEMLSQILSGEWRKYL